MCKRKTIYYILASILFLGLMCYFQRLPENFETSDKNILQAVNGDLQGFSSKRNVGFIYAVWLILGFVNLTNDKVNCIIKYKNKESYLNKIIIKNIVLISLITAIIHGGINLIYNFIYIRKDLLIESNLFMKNLSNSILLGLFYIVVLFIYSILTIYFKKNYSVFFIIIILALTYYFDIDGVLNLLPQRYISKLVTFVSNPNWIKNFILAVIPLFSYCILSYFILNRAYRKKEFY